MTSFDAKLKTWSGRSEKSCYDDDLTIGQIIFEKLATDPDRICQISHTENTTLTRSQLLHNAIKVASYLQAQGFHEETDIVGLLALNSTHVAALAYGCMFNGTPIFCIDPCTCENTTRSLFGLTKPRVIFCDEESYNVAQRVATLCGAEVFIIYGAVVGVKHIHEILQGSLPINYRPASFRRGIDRILAICKTSGSTGLPKAATVTNSRKIFEIHRNLSSNDVQYTPLTITCLVGFRYLICGGIYGALQIIDRMSSFEGARFLDLCEQYRITWALLYTPQMTPIVNSPAISVKKLQSLRQLLFVGACAQVLVLQKLQSHLPKGAVLQLLYGMTELGSSVANNNSVQLRPSSVGELYANIRMRVVDDKGNLLGLNSTGELYCHTGDTWRGYFNDPTSSAQLQDSKGWIHTGDLGYFDDNNQLYIVGRKKEMLRYNGFMYYPQEIEQVILQMTEVAEVCVFGIWLETTEDAAAAIVCAQPNSKLTSAQVVDFIREHIRVEYKQLNAGVLIVDRIPRAQNGKVQRAEAKKIFLKAMCKNESDSEFMPSGLNAGLTPQG